MKYNFPNIKTDEADQIWMKKCYEHMQEQLSGYIDPKIIKIELYGRVPPKYSEYQIDSRLIRGTSLTLMGIWHVDPSSKIIEDIESLILTVKKFIIENPRERNIDIVSLQDNTGFDEVYLMKLLSILSALGKFNKNFNQRRIDLESEDIIDEYLAFSDLNSFVSEWFQREEDQNANITFSTTELPCKLSYEPNTAFIIMSIDPNSNESEEACRVIKEVCMSFDIKAVRADDIEHQEIITEVIINRIMGSEFIIADVSGERPNVYYEIGYAHAIQKKPILYRKKGTKIHFDLANYNIPEYAGVLDLGDKLRKRLSEITGKTIKQ